LGGGVPAKCKRQSSKKNGNMGKHRALKTNNNFLAMVGGEPTKGKETCAADTWGETGREKEGGETTGSTDVEKETKIMEEGTNAGKARTD